MYNFLLLLLLVFLFAIVIDILTGLYHHIVFTSYNCITNATLNGVGRSYSMRDYITK